MNIKRQNETQHHNHNKKVGIVTYICSYNYGSTLQAFALLNVVKSLGYSAQIIDFLDMHLHHNRISRLNNAINRLGCCLFHPSAIVSEIKRYKSVKGVVDSEPVQKKIKFNCFFRDNLTLSKENYYKEVFDYLIAGSDQIWKMSVPGLHNMFFLRFSKRSKRIAYAPSFGGINIPKYNFRLLKKYLSDFDYISVREDSGKEIVRTLIGENVIHVLDPVLLLDASWWRCACKNIEISSDDYILVYLLNCNDNAMLFATSIAVNTGKTIVDISSSNTTNNPCAGPLEFVKYIDQAFCVITDSFHGVAFSSLMNTPFYVFERQYTASSEQSTRIDSFLRLIKAQDRLCRSSEIRPEKMDFNIVNCILEEQREKSISFLIYALGE